MTPDYVAELLKFRRHYGYVPTRLWVERDVYKSMANNVPIGYIPAAWQLFFYGIPVHLR